MKEKLLKMLACDEILNWEKMKLTPIKELDRRELEATLLHAIGKYEEVIQYVMEATDILPSNPTEGKD